MTTSRFTLVTGLLALGLGTGCLSPRTQPGLYSPGQTLAFTGLYTADGTLLQTQDVDSQAIAEALRKLAPGVNWVPEEELNLPVRQVLSRSWTPPDVCLSGRHAPQSPAKVLWNWKETRRPDRLILVESTHDPDFTSARVAEFLVQHFSLTPPPPPPEPAETSTLPAPHPGGLVIVEAKEGAVRVEGAGIKTGRYYVRGPPETFDNPITGEKSVLSPGAVLGLVDLEVVEGKQATGRRVEGESPVGARLEPIE